MLDTTGSIKEHFEFLSVEECPATSCAIGKRRVAKAVGTRLPCRTGFAATTFRERGGEYDNRFRPDSILPDLNSIKSDGRAVLPEIKQDLINYKFSELSGVVKLSKVAIYMQTFASQTGTPRWAHSKSRKRTSIISYTPWLECAAKRP